MAIIVILLIVGVSGYFIYQSLPSTKFEKASTLLDSGNILESITILESVFDKHPDAPAKLAECKYKQGVSQLSNNIEVAISFLNQVIDLKKRLPVSANQNLYMFHEAKAFLEISKINFLNIVSEKPSTHKINRLKDNLKYLDASTRMGFEKNFMDLHQQHILEEAKTYFEISQEKFNDIKKEKDVLKRIEFLKKNIISINEISNKLDVEKQFETLVKNHNLEIMYHYYSLGLNFEKNNNPNEAKLHYNQAKDYSAKHSSNNIITNSITRIEICKLKLNEEVDISLLCEIDKAASDIRTDFYYRYAIRLIKNKKFADADNVISENLKIRSKHINKLKEIILIQKKKEALKQVEKINKVLDRLNEKSFDLTELKSIYENLNKQIELIHPIIPEISEKLQVLKPSLFNRLLTHYISEKQFANAINLIQKYPNFWESPELLKDLGICSYGFSSMENVNEKNYKLIISNWLTAVFSDKVLLKSLEDTNWDDDYTFSLIDSIGSNYEIHETLPDNVNHDDLDETNISIGSAQRELLNQFESLIHKKITDPVLLNTVQEYYIFEKESIERIVSVIAKDTLFAGPHFAKTYGIYEAIISDLDEDYSQYSNEEALLAGIPYLKSNTDTYVAEYNAAKEILEQVSKAILKEDLSIITTANSDRRKPLIEKYPGICNIAEDSLFNSISMKIEEDDENKSLIPIMEEVIKFSPVKEKLKYQYSNYVANYCISQVNNDKINNFKALTLMKNAYLFSQSNQRICKNIITLIKLNLMDILNDQTNKSNDIYKILDEIHQKRSGVFKQSSSELGKTRQDLLNQLKQTGVNISLFEEQLGLGFLHEYLSQEGEKMKKALSYLRKMSEGQTINSDLSSYQMLMKQLGLVDNS